MSHGEDMPRRNHINLKSKFRLGDITTGKFETSPGNQTHDGKAVLIIDDYDYKPFCGSKEGFMRETKKKVSSLV